MPKNAGSKSPRRAGTRPRGCTRCRAGRGRGRSRRSTSQPRSAGKPEIASAPGGDQLPQVLGRAARRPGSGSPSRRSRSGRRRRRRSDGGGLRRRPGRAPEQLAAQVAGEGDRRSGSRRPAVAGRRSPVAAFSRLRSSTAVSESKPRSLNALAGSTASATGVAEHGGGLGADQVDQQRVAARPRSARPAARPARRPAAPAAAAAGAARRAVRTRPRSSGGHAGRPAPGRAARPGRAGSGPDAAAPAARAASKQGQALLGGERGDAAAGHPLEVGLVQGAGHAAAWPTGPRPARSRAARPARRCCGQRVQERVGRRVVALPGGRRTCRPPRRTARTPQVLSLVSSCRCQAASAFGRSTRSSRSAVSEAITPSSSTPAACTTRSAGAPGDPSQLGQRRRGRRRRRPRRAPPRPARPARPPARPRPRLRRAAPGDQQQVASAVLGHQVPGDSAPRSAGAAGDQDRARRIQLQAGAAVGGGRLGQSRAPTPPPARSASCGSPQSTAPRRSARSEAGVARRGRPARTGPGSRSARSGPGPRPPRRPGRGSPRRHRPPPRRGSPPPGGTAANRVLGQPLLDQGERAVAGACTASDADRRPGPRRSHRSAGRRRRARARRRPGAPPGRPGSPACPRRGRREQAGGQRRAGRRRRRLPLGGRRVVSARPGLPAAGRTARRRRRRPGGRPPGAATAGAAIRRLDAATGTPAPSAAVSATASAARRGDPHPQRCGARGVQRDAAPGERQPSPGDAGRVAARSARRRAGRRRAARGAGRSRRVRHGAVRQRDLGEDLVAAHARQRRGPGRPGRSRSRPRPGRRRGRRARPARAPAGGQSGRVEAVCGGAAAPARQQAVGVPGPRLGVLGVLRAGVDARRAQRRRVGLADPRTGPGRRRVRAAPAAPARVSSSNRSQPT